MITDYSFPHYLAAKRSIDDRALNRWVWNRLAQTSAARQKVLDRPLAVLEAAAGIGTMVERTLDWQLFSPQSGGISYTAIDSLPANMDAAAQRLDNMPEWFALRLETADVFDFCQRADEQGRYDLLIAHAFLDLLDLNHALPRLRQLLQPGGLFYFTVNFDGATILQPTLDATLDARIEAAYHRTMDERITDGHPSGDSRTGRHLFAHLPAAGYTIEAAGSSDWVVHPVAGVYPADEAYFLHFIVHTMHGALTNDHSITSDDYSDDDYSDQFERWIAARHAQIDRGELVYIAHQLDFTGHI